MAPIQGLGESGLDIVREAALMEVMFACEAKNNYKMQGFKTPKHDYDKDTNGFMYESSGCIERIMCNQNRALKLYMVDGAPQSSGGAKSMPSVFVFDKPFSCVQGCCMKTVINMSDGNGNALQKAWVKVPLCCNCCGYSGVAGTSDGKQTMKLKHTCMTNGRQCCPFLCGLTIPVENNDGKVIANIKAPSLTLQQCCFQQNHLQIEYVEACDDATKQQIVALMVLVELEYFWNQDN